MALEREIISRIHSAIENKDQEQEKLYKALLGDLVYRKSQGLTDPDTFTPRLEKQLTAAETFSHLTELGVGDLIRLFRRVQGISEAEFASLTGLLRVHIRNFETNFNVPSASSIRDIIDSLGFGENDWRGQLILDRWRQKNDYDNNLFDFYPQFLKQWDKEPESEKNHNLKMDL